MNVDYLLTLAMEAMPVDEFANGVEAHVYGVVSMTLRLQAAEYEAENAKTIERYKFQLSELDEKTGLQASRDIDIMNGLRTKLEAMTKERDALRYELAQLGRNLSPADVPSTGRIHYAASAGHIEA